MTRLILRALCAIHPEGHEWVRMDGTPLACIRCDKRWSL